MSGSLAGGAFPGPFDPDVPRRDVPEVIDGLPKPKEHPDWHKVKPMYENQLRLPEEMLRDPRVAEPIRQIAELTGSTIEEVEQAIMALLTPAAKSKRRH